MSRLMKVTALLGLGITLFGMGSISGARADATYDKLNGNVRHDMDVLQDDQKHLHDMMTKRDMQKASAKTRKYVRQTSMDIHKAQQAKYRHQQKLRRDQRELTEYKRMHKM